MASQQSLSGLPKFGDLKKRLVSLLGALVILRVGAHIPVPGVDAVTLAKLYEGAANGIFEVLNMFSNGSLGRFSIFTVGIMPYISSSVTVQLASEIIPSLKTLKKGGEAGRKIITEYTRYETVLLAALQSSGVTIFAYQRGVVVTSSLEFHIPAVVYSVTGTMFLIWLGGQITERGTGNDISLIIAAGIVSGIPSGIVRLLALTEQGSMSMLMVVSVTVGILLLVYTITYFESAQYKIPVHYTRRQLGSGMMLGQSIYTPLKLDIVGIVPPISASSVALFPSILLGWFGSDSTNSIPYKVTVILQHGRPLYIVLFAITIIFFYYFYTVLVLSPEKMAENLKKNDTFTPGTRPGGQASRYLEKVILRLTLFGILYTTTVCPIPEFLMTALDIPFYLGKASLPILAVVTMDFRTQINSYVASSQYEDLMNRPDMKSLSCK